MAKSWIMLTAFVVSTTHIFTIPFIGTAGITILITVGDMAPHGHSQ